MTAAKDGYSHLSLALRNEESKSEEKEGRKEEREAECGKFISGVETPVYVPIRRRWVSSLHCLLALPTRTKKIHRRYNFVNFSETFWDSVFNQIYL